MTRLTAGALTALMLASAAGCAVDEAGDVAAMAQNACSSDDDCGEGARCRQDMCVAVMVEPFNVYLQVTPTQLPDGSEGRGIWLTPLRVDGPMDPSTLIEVPEPTPVEITVTSEGAPLDASLRFVEVPVAPGLPVRHHEVSVTDGNASVSLPIGARYDVVVEPMVKTLPPLRQTIVIEDGRVLAFDYDAVAISSRQFVLHGLTDGLQATFRAVDSRTGAVVSSIADELSATDTVTLSFTPGDYPYTLEITPTAPIDYEPTGCSRTGVEAPSYRVPLDGAGADPAYEEAPARDGDVPPAMLPARFGAAEPPLEVVLPAVQPTISYRGTVELCDGSGMDPRTVGAIPINLRSTHLLPAVDAGAQADTEVAAVAAFSTSATADFDEDAQKLQFCAEVIPGDYEVVVTAPGSVDCGIFAEQLLLKAPSGSLEKAGDSLALASTASIEGSLSSALTEPISDATVDANPLARAEGINLAEEDRGVTQYNRPRQTTTDDDGRFSLSLDVGAYDVTVKPPAASGLSWLIVRDVLIADRNATFSSELTATVPVPVEGNLVYGSGADGASLAGAQLRAFTLVGEGSEMRTVEIGQVTADDDGHFLLLAPPRTWSGLWGEGAL